MNTTELPTQEQVNEALRSIGNALLKQPYKALWTEENPTLGYCYVVAEAIFHYAPIGSAQPFVMSFPEGGTHWYLKDGDTIIDFTDSQFDFEVDRSVAVRCPFFKGGVQTSRGYISKRGYAIAQALGLTD